MQLRWTYRNRLPRNGTTPEPEPQLGLACLQTGERGHAPVHIFIAAGLIFQTQFVVCLFLAQAAQLGFLDVLYVCMYVLCMQHLSTPRLLVSLNEVKPRKIN